MEQFAWILWIVLGVVLIIAEIFTFGFVLFWFGVGAFLAALAGVLGIGFLGQFLIFALVSTALTILSRTIFSKFLSQGDADQHKSWIDSLPGQVGTVTGAIPGAGANVSAFLAYDIGRRRAKPEEKAKWGKGSYEGIVCAEVANNAN